VLPLSSLVAQDAGTLDAATAKKLHGKRPYSPYVNRKYPTRSLFGDTHLHTGMSMDAGVWRATLKPAVAYRFARGEQVTSSTGQPVTLSRPLDFLVVTDHSDNMGWVNPDQGRCRGASLSLAERQVCRLRDLGQGESRCQPGEDEGDARV
jgi:hypothetical protein